MVRNHLSAIAEFIATRLLFVCTMHFVCIYIILTLSFIIIKLWHRSGLYNRSAINIKEIIMKGDCYE